MRIGIRLAISGLVLASIIITAVGVHLLWWRTAEANSHTLAATINEQIVAAVEKELNAITTQAAAAHTAIRTLFVQNVLETREADKREFVFLSQLQAQPGISWVAFGWPDDAFFAAHKLGDLGLEMMEIGKVDGVVKRRIDDYQVVVGDIEFQKRRFENTDYKVIDQEWYKKGIQADEPSWFEVTAFPIGIRPSIAYAGPIDVYHKRQGVLAVIIENTRLAQFLSQLSVGKSGAAFILGGDGAVIAAPDADADEVHMQRHDQPLLPVAQMALREAGAAAGEADKSRRMRTVTAGDGYAVTLTTLAFPGWTLATVIPEAEFLGPIETTIRRLVIGLAFLVIAAGCSRRGWRGGSSPSRSSQSSTSSSMSSGSSWIKCAGIPRAWSSWPICRPPLPTWPPGWPLFANTFRPISSEPSCARCRASARRRVRTLTVMFTDIVGFTGLSERLGDGIVPVLSRYLDTVSRKVIGRSGTIDKFIGDAVMAFWGAPALNTDHAVDACAAALELRRALQRVAELRRRPRPAGEMRSASIPATCWSATSAPSAAQLHGDRRRRQRRSRLEAINKDTEPKS